MCRMLDTEHNLPFGCVVGHGLVGDHDTRCDAHSTVGSFASASDGHPTTLSRRRSELIFRLPSDTARLGTRGFGVADRYRHWHIFLWATRHI